MAGRPAGPKTRCSGKWTESQFKSFIRSNLRRTTQRWAPIHECSKAARVSRGLYKCAKCEEIVPPTHKVNGKRVKNIHVDHILPIVDPTVGWVSWDSTIERMFCELDGLQLLCSSCHDEKTNEERRLAKVRREKEKI